MLSVKYTKPNNRFAVRQPEKLTATALRSSRHEVVTDTKVVHRATLRPKTGTPEGSTRLSMSLPTRHYHNRFPLFLCKC